MQDSNDFPVLNFQDFIRDAGGKLTTDSLKVAAVFGKSHAHVLRGIDKILSQVHDSFGKSNFGEAEYEYQNNLGFMVKERMFNITRDGFVLLAMSFTGKKALGFKVAYIGAFNAMEQYIKVQQNGLLARHFELQLEHKGKKKRASHAGRVLREWKDEGPMLDAQLKAIDDKMNPQLDLVH